MSLLWYVYMPFYARFAFLYGKSTFTIDIMNFFALEHNDHSDPLIMMSMVAEDMHKESQFIFIGCFAIW